LFLEANILNAASSCLDLIRAFSSRPREGGGGGGRRRRRRRRRKREEGGHEVWSGGGD